MPEFQAVKVPRVSDSIVAQIEGMILEGLLKPGEKLPPERELAERLDVSRPSLREAIVVLEAMQLPPRACSAVRCRRCRHVRSDNASRMARPDHPGCADCRHT